MQFPYAAEIEYLYIDFRVFEKLDCPWIALYNDNHQYKEKAPGFRGIVLSANS